MSRLTPDQLAARVTVIDVDQVTLLEGNPNRADEQAIARSMDEFGQVATILVQDGVVVDGNHRVLDERKHRRFDGKLAAIDITGLEWSEARAAAAGLGLNITARLGADDPQALRSFLERIADDDRALLHAISYRDDLTLMVDDEPPPLDLDSGGGGGGSEAHHEPPPSRIPAEPQTRPGDLWQCGPHRVLCGDSRDPDHVALLLDGASINLAVTSPPYADRRTYDAASGFKPISPDDYVEWFAPVAANVSEHLADGGSWFVNIKASVTPDGEATELYVLDLVLAHCRLWGWKLATEFCWERIGVPKSVSQRFKNQFEPIYQFHRGRRWKMRPDNVRHATDAALIPPGPGSGDTNWGGRSHDVDPQGTPGGNLLGRRRVGSTDWSGNDRNSTSLPQGGGGDMFADRRQAGDVVPGLAYPGNRLPTFNSTHEAVGHTAAYPVGLPEFFIKAFTDPGDTVYDPFLGSGSTLLAAHRQDRIGYGIEISPGYCDVLLDRWCRHHPDLPPTRPDGSTYQPQDPEP